jgi:hypothetical protein
MGISVGSQRNLRVHVLSQRAEEETMRTRLLLLLLMGCPGGEDPLPSCELEIPPVSPSVPSCDDIEGRIAEVDIADWRDRFEGDSGDAIFVSQQRCDDDADGSLAHPFCWIDDGIQAAEGSDHAALYLGPGEYSIMGELPCGQAQGHLPSIELIGAGANTTRLHVTCDLAEGKWSLQDLSLASDLMVVAPGTELTLRRVVEQNLSGSSFLDVQGGLTIEDMVLDLESPLVDDSEENEGTSLLGMPPLTGSDFETEVAVRLSDGAWGVGSGLCLLQAANGGILVTGAGTTLDLIDSVISDTQASGDYGEPGGYGISVEAGAELDSSGLLLSNNDNANLLVHQASADLEGSIIELAESRGQYGGGVGVLAQDGSDLSISASLLQDNEEVGAAVTEGAALSIDGSTLQGHDFAGIVVLAASLELSASMVGDDNGGEIGEIAVFAHDISASHPVQLDLHGNVFLEDDRGVYLRGDPDRTSAVIEDNRFQVEGDRYCASLFAVETSEALEISGNCFEGRLQLLLHEATASLGGNQYEWVEEVETIKQQACDGITPVDISQEILPDPDNTAICTGNWTQIDPQASYFFELTEPDLAD